jgi:hypothetical protein
MPETKEYLEKISEIQEHYQKDLHRSISLYEAIAIFLSEIALVENEQVNGFVNKFQNNIVLKP